MRNWNSRYAAYARDHGLEPKAMLAADEAEWPGGKMAGFMVWVQARWHEWRVLRKVCGDHVLSAEDHADFDRWLEEARCEGVG